MRFDYFACFIVNANHSVPITAAKLLPGASSRVLVCGIGKERPSADLRSGKGVDSKEQPRQLMNPWEIPAEAVIYSRAKESMRSGSGPRPSPRAAPDENNAGTAALGPV